jgi:hypothetical protein
MIPHSFKTYVRNYAVLALTLLCAALPSRADTMTVQQLLTNASSGTFVVSGFDASLGTLEYADVTVQSGLTLVFIVASTDTLTNESAVIDQSVTLPDGSVVPGALTAQTDVSGTLVGKVLFSPEIDATYDHVIDDPAALADFLAPQVSIGFSGEAGISSPSTLPDDIAVEALTGAQLTLTYGYTPAVAPVPEPSAVFLFGGAVTLCIWKFRKGRALRNH